MPVQQADSVSLAQSMGNYALTAATVDTGVTRCSDGLWQNLSCPQPAYPGQDAEFGRDVVADKDVADPTQRVEEWLGHNGFDYDKLDHTGQLLTRNATQWACVRDNVTGLIWEVKRDDKGIHDLNNSYSWYRDSLIDDPGLPDQGSCQGSACDTQAFIATLNEQKLCGYDGWRIPQREQLRTIINYGIDEHSPVVDADYFGQQFPAVFWSATTTAKYPELVWKINFRYGFASTGVKNENSLHSVIAVYQGAAAVVNYKQAESDNCRKTDQGAAAPSRYQQLSDGTVLDHKTSLLWQRCSYGQTLRHGRCVGEAKAVNWQQALLAARKVHVRKNNYLRWSKRTIIKQSDWRLPNIKELNSLLSLNCSEPAIDAESFPDTPALKYWSATPYVNRDGWAWYVDFSLGDERAVEMVSKRIMRVRFVRAYP